MNQNRQIDLDIAILGGGFAGVYCAKALSRELGRASAQRVGLISDENYMVFQPMLPEVAGGAIAARHVISPLRLLCRPARVLKGRVEQIRWADRSLVLNAGPFSGSFTLRFQHLVLALGAAVDLSKIPGMPEHGFLMRNVGDAMNLRTTIIGRLEEANLETRPEIKQRLLTFVVVGGGYSGVETAGHILDLFRSVYHYYPRIAREDLVVYLVHSRDHLLPTLSRRLGEYSAQKLTERGLRIILNERVKAVTADRVHLGSDKTIETNTVIATVGNAPHPLVQQLCRDEKLECVKGQVLTDEYCRVKGQSRLWAAGDCAAVPYVEGGYCPNTAQFAMRQGKLIGRNIARLERGHDLRKFTFKELGEMASIGHYEAVADVFGRNFSGFFAWWLWRTVYLMKLPRLDRKLRVMLDWTLDLFFPRDINHLSPRYSTTLKEIYLEPGDVLFHRDEPAFSLYIVKTGSLEIADGDEVIRQVGEGDYFGEAALLDSRIWRHEARAIEPTRLVSIPADVFQQIVTGARSLSRFFRKSAAKYQSHEALDQFGRRMPVAFLNKPVAEVMQRELYKLEPGMTVEDALQLARTYPRSSYPMVDPAGKLLGVVEREDFYEFLKRPETRPGTLIGDMRLTSLPAFHLTATVREVLEGLLRRGANKSVVVDEANRPAGIVTILDLLAAHFSEALQHKQDPVYAALDAKG